MQSFWCALHLHMSHPCNLILQDPWSCESGYRSGSKGRQWEGQQACARQLPQGGLHCCFGQQATVLGRDAKHASNGKEGSAKSRALRFKIGNVIATGCADFTLALMFRTWPWTKISLGVRIQDIGISFRTNVNVF